MTDFELFELYNNADTKNNAIIEALNKSEAFINSLIYTHYPNLNLSYIDDVKQECRITVIKTLNTFNPNMGASFLTWLRLPLLNTITSYINQSLNGASSYMLKKYGYFETVPLLDCHHAKNELEDFLERKYITNIISKALSTLKPKQRYIIMRHYGLGHYTKTKPNVLAKELNISVSSLYDARRRAETKMKEALLNEKAYDFS